MGADSKNQDMTLDIKVDTSSLEKATVLMERLAAAAERACDAIVTFNGAPLVAEDVVTCELQADDTHREILCELKALRADLADLRVFEKVECAVPLMSKFAP